MERQSLFNKYSISTTSPQPPPKTPAMCSGPLGKFNGYFSIVSTLRGQYITANEPCQFYYQWSPAPRITTRLHTPPHLPGLTKTASLDQSVTPGPPLSTFWPVFFPLPSSTALLCLLSLSVFCAVTLLVEETTRQLLLAPRSSTLLLFSFLSSVAISSQACLQEAR